MMEHIKSFFRIDDRFSGMDSFEKCSEEMYKRYQINNLWKQKGRKSSEKRRKASLCGEFVDVMGAIEVGALMKMNWSEMTVER
jgi:hypothetical protein